MKTSATRLTWILVLLVFSLGAYATPPVGEDDWGLKIVIFDVGQADAALLLTPDGHAALIDMGKTKSQGKTIAQYLASKTSNGAASMGALDLLFCSHYDADHIGGASGLNGQIAVSAAYDQGPSAGRDALSNSTFYSRYVKYVGDPNGNGRKDAGEPGFVRHRAEPGETFTLGESGAVKIRVLSVRGDTAGNAYDLPLDPADRDIDENPGCLTQLITLNDFEYLSMGDATSDDWKNEPDTEEALISADAIPGGPDIDVLKVGHHGSDTSTGKRFAGSIRPEVAIISSDLAKDNLPKLTSIKVLDVNKAEVLVTGRARDKDGRFHQSTNAYDDDYEPVRLRDEVGTVTIRISPDGSKYTVTCENDPALVITKFSKDPS